jgi:hypothetical protein
MGDIQRRKRRDRHTEIKRELGHESSTKTKTVIKLNNNYVGR